jgi:hypothetical protein
MFITLPSNASTDAHPENNASSYIVKLPDRLEFGHGWRVGLAEIHFPLSFDSAKRDQRAALRLPFPLPRPVPRPPMLPPPVRPTPPLVTNIPPRVQFPRPTQRAPTNVQGPMSHGKLPKGGAPGIPEIPPDVDIEEEEEEGYADYTPEDIKNRRTDFPRMPAVNDLELVNTMQRMQATLNSINANIGALLTSSSDSVAIDMGAIYVYSDIVEPHIVGDVRAPLLRIVKIPSVKVHGLSAVATYDSPYYMPLGKREFSQIEIELRDVAGNLLPFTKGTSIVTLHFKRDALP